MRSSRTSRPQHWTRKKFSYEVPCALFSFSVSPTKTGRLSRRRKQPHLGNYFHAIQPYQAQDRGACFGGKVSEGRMQGYHAVLSALQMDSCVSVFAVPRSVLGCLIDRLFFYTVHWLSDLSTVMGLRLAIEGPSNTYSTAVILRAYVPTQLKSFVQRNSLNSIRTSPNPHHCKQNKIQLKSYYESSNCKNNKINIK